MDFLATCLQAATPIWLAALGGLYAQRAGVLHLGLEGLMLVGAFGVVALGAKTGSMTAAITLTIAINLVLSLIFWLLITHLRANVIIVGLALSLLAASATTFGLVAMFGSQAALQSDLRLARLFGGDLTILTAFAAVASVVTWVLINRTRWGLRLTVCGRDTFAARSAGVHIDRARLAALLIAGTLCSLAGIELALANVQSFSQDMTQGRGYVAFIAVLLGGVTPLGTSIASLFFGFTEALGIESQLSLNGTVPTQVIQMIPYVVTIVAMVTAGAAYRRRGMSVTGTPEALQ